MGEIHMIPLKINNYNHMKNLRLKPEFITRLYKHQAEVCCNTQKNRKIIVKSTIKFSVRHSEFISESPKVKEMLKQVQHDGHDFQD